MLKHQTKCRTARRIQLCGVLTVILDCNFLRGILDGYTAGDNTKNEEAEKLV